MVFKTKGTSPLTARVNLRLLPDEHEQLKNDAHSAGLCLSEIVRSRYFGKKITAKVDQEMIRELRRVGGLLKAVHVESAGAYSKQTADALVQLGQVIDQLAKGK